MGEEKEEKKPAVLIVGGLGYVGRFLAKYIHSKNLASTLRIVDKQLPELAWLAPEFKDACSRTNYVQADASRPQHLGRIFDLKTATASSSKGKEAETKSQEFDYVFNCAGTDHSSTSSSDESSDMHRMRTHALSLSLATEAARRNISVYVELSTGNVYKSSAKKPATEESGKLKPITKQAKWKLAVEEDIRKLCEIKDGEIDKSAGRLNAAVLRLANVYGPYVTRFLGQALCLARVCQAEEREEDRKMRWLWGEDLRTDTVHVEDVAGALWAVADWFVKTPRSERGNLPIFNIVDQGETTQGVVASIIREKFGIPTPFEGTLKSQFAKLHLDSVVDDLNNDTLEAWADLKEEAGTDPNAPLNPYMEKETVRDEDLALDGSKFIKTVGYRYKHPRLTKEEVDEVIESYKRMNWWP